MKRELAQALAPALLLMALAAALEGVCALLLAAAVASWRQNPGHWLGLLALATPLALAVQYAAATRGFFAGGAVMNALLRALFRRLPRAVAAGADAGPVDRGDRPGDVGAGAPAGAAGWRDRHAVDAGRRADLAEPGNGAGVAGGRRAVGAGVARFGGPAAPARAGAGEANQNIEGR